MASFSAIGGVLAQRNARIFYSGSVVCWTGSWMQRTPPICRCSVAAPRGRDMGEHHGLRGNSWRVLVAIRGRIHGLARIAVGCGMPMAVATAGFVTTRWFPVGAS